MDLGRRLLDVRLGVALALLATFAHARGDGLAPLLQDVRDIQELSLEDLLDSEVLVATKTPLTMRDTPAIVSVVRRDEIVRSGARDLLDILQLVPGFTPAVDVEGIVDVGFRGQWGHEGKILVLLDGQEMNETLYSTMQMGMHVPAEHIERVEVIRGPGSVIYGGMAELAVINVITRGPKELHGAAGSLYYGQMEHGFGRFQASASYGEEFKRVPGLGVSLETFYGRGKRSDLTYNDFTGGSYSMSDSSTLEELMVNLGVHYRDLKLRFIYDDHHPYFRDSFGAATPVAYDQRFRSFFLDLLYDAHLAHHIVLTPRLSYKRQTPWQVLDESAIADGLYYDKTADRLRGSLTLSWDIKRYLNLLVGAEAFWDHAHVTRVVNTGSQIPFGNSTEVDYGNLAGFAQLIWKNFVVNVAVGARYEYHSKFGSSFVPRVALTKVWRRLNFKLLYSEAFRAPGIENLNLNPDIQPERTRVVEGEVGVEITSHMAVTVNGYWMRIERPIVYDVDQNTNTELYLNSSHTGTAGVEAQYRVRYPRGFGTLTYSFYSSAGQNDVALYAVPGHDDVTLGLPAHKVTLSGAVDVWRDHVTLAGSGVFMSRRYGYLTGDGQGNGVLGSEPPLYLVNLHIMYRNLGVRGLDLSVGVVNLLDQAYRALQPYNGGHAPLPLGSREVFARLSYNLEQ